MDSYTGHTHLGKMEIDMKFKQLSSALSVSDQLTVMDLDTLSRQGVRNLICNRPDGEAAGQPGHEEIAGHARALGMEMYYLPVVHDTIQAADVEAFDTLLRSIPGPVHAYCRSGLRSITLWSLSRLKHGAPLAQVVSDAGTAGYDFANFGSKFGHILQQYPNAPVDTARHAGEVFSLLIVGAGAAGIAVAASLLKRLPHLDIALVDPADVHYYQPGFTMVGGGVFTMRQTRRDMASLIPEGVTWIKAAVSTFEPTSNHVILEDGRRLEYQRLVVCPGLKLNWAGVEGLAETLGRNGVTSNYQPGLAAYTWELVQNLKSGKAFFTQPPMPIKCAGAPQKALYLSADHWHRSGVLGNIDIRFYNAGAALFGVKDYVPALQSYMDHYKASIRLNHNLVKVDGPKRLAWFESKDGEGNSIMHEERFDMLHVTPPQTAPDFIRASPLADAAGWVDVDPATLRHKHHANIWALGDVANSPNAKTAAAVRKQAPIVASNILADIEGGVTYGYDGYGACPLTVARGKIVLAEFGYGGKLLPTLPTWLLQGTQPTRLAWHLKAKVMPQLYWNAMLKGHEWMVQPDQPVQHEAE